MKHTYLTCGKIVSTHGVRGAVKAEAWCDSPAVLAGFDRVYFREGDTYTPHAVRGAFVSGRQVVLTHNMPPNNVTERTDVERGGSAAWLADAAR